MGLKCGIVGLPNVGKSTLFNALTNSSQAQAENFPFCTIEPNIGVIPIIDDRLDKLVKISKSKKKIYNTISFVDIAGLVEGASKGEGLGNKFLSHIREVDTIVHMIRCFDSEKIQHINNKIDPLRDLEIIETEMKLADIDSIEKRLNKKNKKEIDKTHNNILETTLKVINNNHEMDNILKNYDEKDLRSVHSDFEKGFIRAETISFDDFIKHNGWLESKNNGKMRLEGKDYIVKDGDVLNFRFNT